MAIRVELNEFKMKEMSVHNESRKNTLFYDVGKGSLNKAQFKLRLARASANGLRPPDHGLPSSVTLISFMVRCPDPSMRRTAHPPDFQMNG